MYKTKKSILKKLSVKEFDALRELCKLSKNMYNVTLYNTRQYYFKESRLLKYESNYHICKENENYKLLQSQIAQQTMRCVERNFKSFLTNSKQFDNYPNKYAGEPKIPKYIKRTEYFSLFFPQFKIIEHKIRLPLAPVFKKKYGNIIITIPEYLQNKKIREIRIHPRNNGKYFEIEYVYEEVIKEKKESNENLSIDLGLNNLATCVSTNTRPFIMDGKKLKSVNQWYNKELAKLSSIKDKQKFMGKTKRIINLTNKRNCVVNDVLSKTARYIINFCLSNGIGKIIIGYNPTWKQNINIGKRNNQNFVQIPHGKLREKIKHLCEEFSLEYIEQEESYTSNTNSFK